VTPTPVPRAAAAAASDRGWLEVIAAVVGGLIVGLFVSWVKR
jgi:hypothetical protein